MQTPSRLLGFVLCLEAAATLASAQSQFSDLGKQLMPNLKIGTEALALGDVDGDGDLDVMFGNETGANTSLYLNDGRGRFSDVTAQSMPRDNAWTYGVALGDVDGDGDLDAVLGNNRSHPSQLYLNDGKGKFSDVTSARMPNIKFDASAVGMADLDGDGDLDLFLAGYVQSRLYLNNGKGVFSDATASSLPQASRAFTDIALGDVDGDGDLDAVLVGAPGRLDQNRLYLNDGKAKFSDATASLMPKDIDTSLGVVLGDVDGDGDLDLAIANHGRLVGLQNRLYLNNGKGAFSDATAKQLPIDSDFTTSVSFGDVDQDGDLDLFFGTYLQSSDKLYLNDGKGRFSDVSASRLPGITTNVRQSALADVDGDGDADLVLGDFLWGQSRVYLNLHRQLDAPLPAVIGKNYRLDFYAKPGYASSTQATATFLNVAPAVSAITIPNFGSFGLSLSGLIALPVVRLPAPAGKLAVNLTIPSIPTLARGRNT